MKWIAPYEGTDWFYDDERRPTVYEAQLMLQVSGGLYGEELTLALAREHPNAWLAALVVARKRSGMPADRARKVDPDRLELEDCIAATLAEAERAKAESKTPEAEAKPASRRRAKAPAAEDAPAA